MLCFPVYVLGPLNSGNSEESFVDQGNFFIVFCILRVITDEVCLKVGEAVHFTSAVCYSMVLSVLH